MSVKWSHIHNISLHFFSVTHTGTHTHTHTQARARARAQAQAQAQAQTHARAQAQAQARAQAQAQAQSDAREETFVEDARDAQKRCGLVRSLPTLAGCTIEVAEPEDRGA